MSLDVEGRADVMSTLLERPLLEPVAVEHLTARTHEPIEILHTEPLLDPTQREEASSTKLADARDADDLELDAAMFQKYVAPSQLWDWRQLASLLLGDLAGKDVLDFGCGTGEESVYLAKLGARVSAIDISEVGVRTLKKRVEAHKLDVRAFEMRCDQTSFADESFDLVHGMEILHHVGIESALAEVWRVLRPGGTAVFLEPMGDAPAIEAVKAFLMRHARFLGKFNEVADHEDNLTWSQIGHATTRFSRATTYPYHLLYRLKRFAPASILDAIRRFDHGVMSMVPSLRHYAGAVVIHLVK